MQGLVLLFKTGNRLAHPRPRGGIAAWASDVEDSDEIAIGPKAALSAVLTVDEVISRCTELRRHPNLHRDTAKMIRYHRQVLERHNELCGPKVLDIPKTSVSSQPPLMDQTMQIVADAPTRTNRLQQSWHRAR